MKSEEYAEMMNLLKKARCLKRVSRLLLLARVVRSDNECLPLLQLGKIGVLREAGWGTVVCKRKLWMILRRRGEMGDGARVFRYIFHESFHMILFPLHKGLSDWILTLREKSPFPRGSPLGNIFISAYLCLTNLTFFLLENPLPPTPTPQWGT